MTTARAWALKHGASVLVDEHRGSVRVDNPPPGFDFTHGTAEEFFRRIGGKPERAPDPGPITPQTATTPAEYHAAIDSWGANCGVTSFCALLGMSFDKAKQVFMPRFARDGCVRSDHMRAALTKVGVAWEEGYNAWPKRGLVTVRWADRDGGASQSHWVCVSGGKVFDGYDVKSWGWMSVSDWERVVFPKLPGSTGERGSCIVADAIKVH